MRLSMTVAAIAALAGSMAAEPIKLHLRNPHYFQFRDKPILLITSAEHYGAVMNLDFDYIAYLNTLKADRLNYTRIFSGVLVEDWGAPDNTINPAANRLILPWARSVSPGYAAGGNKFDLDSWDPAYWTRLKDFVRQAGDRGIVVEMTLFSVMYGEGGWKRSPLHPANNVNGIGTAGRGIYTLADSAMLRVQADLVRKFAAELAAFDNVFFELCNEPYWDNGPVLGSAWNDRMIAAIRSVDKTHLIALNVANGSTKVEAFNPEIGIFNYHYSSPPASVGLNSHHNRAVVFDESGFRGKADLPYRQEAWEFILAGGAGYNNLDWSFTAQSEIGGFTEIDSSLGGGSVALRNQLGYLKEFVHGFEFTNMRPDNAVVQGGVPGGGGVTVLSEPGKAYAVFVRGGARTMLQLALPAGAYFAVWLNTKTGKVEKQERVAHAGGPARLESPAYGDDIALSVKHENYATLIAPRYGSGKAAMAGTSGVIGEAIPHVDGRIRAFGEGRFLRQSIHRKIASADRKNDAGVAINLE